MNKEKEFYRNIIDMLKNADEYIWKAVTEIQNEDTLNELAMPLMKLRGELYVDFLRPLYKKYPELDESDKLNDEQTLIEINKMLENEKK